jgi:hypothetical protein
MVLQYAPWKIYQSQDIQLLINCAHLRLFSRLFLWILSIFFNLLFRLLFPAVLYT